MNTSLSDTLMRRMVVRVDHLLEEEGKAVPEEKLWHFLQVYMRLDPLLAQLFKQYSEAKANLGKLLVERGSEDPMTEIAWDMHDSLRGAVETRLIELKADEKIEEEAQLLIKEEKSKVATRRTRREMDTETESFNRMMTFMVWAGMALKGGNSSPDLRREFCLAS